jgi:anti-sigma B factor antagonist
MEEFRIERRRTPLADIVRIAGDADLYVAPELERAFAQVADSVPRAAVVDMTALTFLDSTALGQLLAFRRWLEASEVPLLLVCDNRAVLRAFEITALDRRFQIVPTLSDALRSVVEVSAAVA